MKHTLLTSHELMSALDLSMTGLNIDMSLNYNIPAFTHVNDTLYMIEEIDQDTDVITSSNKHEFFVDDVMFAFGHHQNLL